ncbi:SNF2-related protein [Niveomyces insectorum RCEF 264]|uniref:SNF2-related protein n=1 Tax=Niveomyces insectorum RCEF 264 TaxID=1081102 RepID=A0A167ZXY7_9HYPO|nr:SNF2-related protein [Niveomyces insectorum RCEF 264]
MSVPVEIDPFASAVTPCWRTLHIADKDNGEGFLQKLANIKLLGVDRARAKHAPKPAADGSLTLAHVPYQVLRLEVTSDGVPKPPENSAFGLLDGRTGYLNDYYTNHGNTGYWNHLLHEPKYHEGYPYSADNFDCETLVEDLEDDCSLANNETTTWALWVSVISVRPREGGKGADPSALAPAPGSDDQQRPDYYFEEGRRISNVQDFVDELYKLRLRLADAPTAMMPTNDADGTRGKLVKQFSTPLVRFIVAVSRNGAAPYLSPMSPSKMFFQCPQRGPIGMVTMELNRMREMEAQGGTSSSSSSIIRKREQATAMEDLWKSSNLSREVFEFLRNPVVQTRQPTGPYPEARQRRKETSAERSKRYAKEDTSDPMFRTVSNVTGPENDNGAEEKPTLDESGSLTGWRSDTPSWSSESESSGALLDTSAGPSMPPSPVESPPALPPKAAPSIFETLDTNAAKGDAIEGDLHALLPEAQSPSDAAWQQCCALLCIDPEAHKDAQALSIKVPGTDNMRVKPSQLWTAYWMLTSRTDRGLCGGVLADVMGTGKTYVCLLLCLLRAYIFYNRTEVEREWQLREHEAKKSSRSSGGGDGGGGSGNIAPKQHLPQDAGDGTASIPCSCGNAMGIECYANPGGVTRRIADTVARGPSLILAPQTVLDNWIKTVKHVRLQHKYYEPIVFHSKMTKEDTVMAPAPRLKQKLQMDVLPQPHVSGDGLFPQSWEPNVFDTAYAFKPGIAKDTFPERFIVLATHTPEKLTAFFQVPVPLRRKPGGGTRERKTVYSCPVGIQLVDEFHKAKDDVVALARQHKHIQRSSTGGADNFDFWAISGTPLPSKLTDLEAVTDIVQRLPEWDDPSSRHYGSRVVALRELQVAYEHAVAEDGTPEQAAEFRARAERFFQGELVKRHTEASLFFGQRIFNLQDVAPEVVVHATPDKFRADVAAVAARIGSTVRGLMEAAPAPTPTTQAPPTPADGSNRSSSSSNWAQAVRSSSLFNHMMNLEILATFPGAARLMLSDPPALDFGLTALRAEIRNAKDHDVAQVALFQTHLETVIEGSPHLASVLATLDEMARDKQRRLLPPALVATEAAAAATSSWPNRKTDARLKKLVVLCPRMGEAVFLYLALRARRPDAHPLFVHADLRLAERTAVLQEFNRLDGHSSSTARVLVGTFRDAGTGNDLSVANYQILTGPLRLRSQQDQAFGRTNREGQTLRLHHRLLVTEDSPVDRLVMATQARRRIASDPFAIDEPLQLEVEEKEEKEVVNEKAGEQNES